MKNMLFIPAIVLLLIGGCRKTDTGTMGSAVVKADSSSGILVADTIISDVDIVNIDPGDAWNQYRLKGLNHKALIDNIMSMIQSGQAVAYNFETQEKLTPGQIEKMEKSGVFNRDEISMIQFREAWYIQPETGLMTKKVYSMVLGRLKYGDQGEVFGHEAVFRVDL
ncbi:MAG: hypothetical protein JXQ80_06575 [Bacteroidales bacterium]|nr:hypothetical protein [Bacteroidales bacterium]